MIIADLNNVARIHGGRTIFRGLSWALEDGEKIGLIGPSGCGKSTLLRTLAGEEKPDEGAVTFRRGAVVAYLPQEYTGDPARAVIDELLAARADLDELNHRIAEVEHAMSDPANLADAEAFDKLLHKHADLLYEYEKTGAAMVRNEAEGLLRALGFAESAWTQPMSQLSGG